MSCWGWASWVWYLWALEVLVGILMSMGPGYLLAHEDHSESEVQSFSKYVVEQNARGDFINIRLLACKALLTKKQLLCLMLTSKLGESHPVDTSFCKILQVMSWSYIPSVLILAFWAYATEQLPRVCTFSSKEFDHTMLSCMTAV